MNDYYNLVTDFYEYGWGTSFHFCTQRKGESYKAALARHEHFLALKLKIGPGKVALDCGCGVGGPAREIAVSAPIVDLFFPRRNHTHQLDPSCPARSPD